MTQLFAVLLGGNAANSNIEVHDVRFVVGDSIEATYETLRREWFGFPEGLHIDAYKVLDHIDGYSISLKPEPPEHPERLYFVNLGGYDPEKFVELHESGFFVSTGEKELKKRAKSVLLKAVKLQHRDDLYDIDECLAITQVGSVHIHLTRIDSAEASLSSPTAPTWFGYLRIDGQPQDDLDD